MTCAKVLLILLSLYIIQTKAARSTSFPIGGLFNRLTQPSSVRAFENIVKPTGARAFHGRMLNSEVVDSYSTSLELCPFTSNNKGIVALIDARPTNGICDISCLLCNQLNITHLSLGWELPETLAEDLYTFSYHPPPDLISKAYATLIKQLQWDKFTIFYEDDGSFIRLQEIINTWPSKFDPILFRKLDPDGDNREIFKYVFKVAHISYHILDCDVKSIPKYMEEIIRVENSTEYQSFILTNLDAYTVNFEDMPDVMANVSTMHLTAANDVRWKDIGMGSYNEYISLETALVADALNHVEKAIKKMQIGNDGLFNPSKLQGPPAICFKGFNSEYEEDPWLLGNDLRRALIETTSNGFTGNIQFDDEGKRINFILHFSKLNKDSQFFYAGKWNSSTNLIVTENKQIQDRSLAMKSNSKLRVVTRKDKPYFDIVETENGTMFRGYAVDLIAAIVKHIKKHKGIELEYEFYRVANDNYGHRVPGSKKWDGIIGEILEHKAELAVCDITITSERNSVVDFSIPFMTLGISMLFKEEDPLEPDMFSFINPLSLDVWLYLATTYIVVSFILLICARMSQEDWVNPHKCNQNPENFENIWSLYNCMWLTMGSIMTQGCDILPRAAGSRWISGMWWFFALIVTASYTANMSTFLSNSRRNTEIKDVKGLSEQNQVSYGAVYNASTYKFFETSNDSVYEKIWTVMKSSKPTVFTYTNEEGKERVLKSKGNYAFFMESTAIEYFMNRHCELKMVGQKLDAKEYGIAMPKNYPRKGLVDNAILSLQESGELDALKTKWWETEDNTENCKETETEKDDSGSLQMKNTSGIFLVLGIGGVLGLFVAVVDFLLHVRQISVKEKVTFKEALESEWRTSLDPRMLQKSAAPARSAPPSTASPSPSRERSQSRAVSVLRGVSSFINFDEIY